MEMNTNREAEMKVYAYNFSYWMFRDNPHTNLTVEAKNESDALKQIRERWNLRNTREMHIEEA